MTWEWREAPSLEEAVPGQRLATPEGDCYLVRQEYPISYHFGGRPLEDARQAAGTTLAALARDDELRDVTLDEACFLDTETTGLAGGTGTHVFLVGLGYFAGDFFRIDQYFMEDYDQEPGLVAALDDAMRGFRAVVSFNGKAFDLPLIETRFILCRRRPPLGGRPHLDLLHPSRRLWGPRLESCRLVALEEAILGETRVGDIPGSLVPEYYFQYLRDRDPRVLRPIFDHNRQDVLSLLALAGVVAERFELFLEDRPGAGAGGGDAGAGGLDPHDLLGLARLYASLGLREAAVRSYQAFFEAELPGHLVDRAGVDYVRLLRRLGRTAEATSVCERLADGYPQRVWALIELAKELEHRARDFERAIAVVDRALGLMAGTLPEAEDARRAELTAALEWRRDRLARKAAKANRRATGASRGRDTGASRDVDTEARGRASGRASASAGSQSYPSSSPE